MTTLHHMGITVSNIDVAMEFYRHIIGGTIDGPYEKSGPAVDAATGCKGVTVFLAFIVLDGESVIELAEYRNGSDERAPTDTNRPGVGHPAFVVDDIEDAILRAEQMGYPALSEPKTATAGPMEGYRYVYLLGPDQLRVELLETPHLPSAVHPPSTATH